MSHPNYFCLLLSIHSPFSYTHLLKLRQELHCLSESHQSLLAIEHLKGSYLELRFDDYSNIYY